MDVGLDPDNLRVIVATEIMGLELWYGDPTGFGIAENMDFWVVGSECDYSGELSQRCPDYPRNIADAWLVVEKLRERGLMWRGGYFPEFGCAMGFGFAEQGAEEVTFKASADTAPLAICLAALKVVEVT